MNIYWSKNQIPLLKGLSQSEQQSKLKQVALKALCHWQVWLSFFVQILFICWFVFLGPVFSYKFWVVLVLAFVTAKLASLPLNHFLAKHLDTTSGE